MAPDFLPPAKNQAERPSAPAPDMRIAVSALIAQGQIEVGLRAYVDSGHGAGAWDRTPEIFKRVAIANARSIDAMIADNTGALSTAVARQVRATTLLLAGTKSPPIFHRTIEVLLGAIAGSRREAIEGADHFLTLTHADEMNRSIEKFWTASEAL
jgi:pimeloyl-ACP methyl ester carboxylesterase